MKYVSIIDLLSHIFLKQRLLREMFSFKEIIFLQDYLANFFLNKIIWQ